MLQKCNKVFGKMKIRLINKFEWREYGYLIQVSSQDKVKVAMIKENSSRFKLFCNSPLSEDYSYSELGLLGKGKLVEEILHNKSVLQE